MSDEAEQMRRFGELASEPGSMLVAQKQEDVRAFLDRLVALGLAKEVLDVFTGLRVVITPLAPPDTVYVVGGSRKPEFERDMATCEEDLRQTIARLSVAMFGDEK